MLPYASHFQASRSVVPEIRKLARDAICAGPADSQHPAASLRLLFQTTTLTHFKNSESLCSIPICSLYSIQCKHILKCSSIFTTSFLWASENNNFISWLRHIMRLWAWIGWSLVVPNFWFIFEFKTSIQSFYGWRSSITVSLSSYWNRLIFFLLLAATVFFQMNIFNYLQLNNSQTMTQII